MYGDVWRRPWHGHSHTPLIYFVRINFHLFSSQQNSLFCTFNLFFSAIIILLLFTVQPLFCTLVQQLAGANVWPPVYGPRPCQ